MWTPKNGKMMMKTSMTIDSLPVYVIDDYLYEDLVEEFGTSIDVEEMIDWLEEWVKENVQEDNF